MTREPDDIDHTYRSYDSSGRAAERWSASNPGNRAIHLERNAALEAILGRCAADRPVAHLLEVGCGGGALLDEVARMPPARSAVCAGIDLLAFRLHAGRQGGHRLAVAQADGQRLPFPALRFDVVLLSTVMSSVLDDDLARRIAAEVDRVLQPGGSVVWYDMRLPNPSNRNVRPFSRSRVTSLWPGYTAELRSITLIPQVARRLGRSTHVAYRLMAAAPALRSHLVGRLTKPPHRS